MKMVVANWKMHMSGAESERFFKDLMKEVTPGGVEVVIAPSNFALYSLSKIKQWQFSLAAQNFYHMDYGAYTGETAVRQLVGVADYALVGHSERRQYFRETNKDTRRKVAAALSVGVKPILCVGETAMERENKETDDVVRDQLLAGLADVTPTQLKDVVIAYEPRWAISTAKNVGVCTPEDARSALTFIRQQLKELYGKTARVLYGGSVKSDNIVSYLKKGEADGALVGGASLQLKEFGDIIEATKAVR
ncbi:triose-phosphate isomerase [Candidatus Saccharibacteria bacterium]|nr:triose-phosphate isomerase [Candidatus Saccharibacteria bacterium]